VSAFRYAKSSYSYDTKQGQLKRWVLPLGVFIGAILLAFCLNFAGCNAGYSLNKAIGAPYNLANAAPNAMLVRTYLDQLDAGLVAKNATTGHTVLIFKTNANSLSTYQHNLTELRARAQYVATIDQSSISYQYAITNLKEAVQNLGNPSNGIYWVRYWWLTGLTVLAYIGVVVIAVWLFVELTY
jgi:hypothetical protein